MTRHKYVSLNERYHLYNQAKLSEKLEKLHPLHNPLQNQKQLPDIGNNQVMS
jgi:hypothetical protein